MAIIRQTLFIILINFNVILLIDAQIRNSNNSTTIKNQITTTTMLFNPIISSRQNDNNRQHFANNTNHQLIIHQEVELIKTNTHNKTKSGSGKRKSRLLNSLSDDSDDHRQAPIDSSEMNANTDQQSESEEQQETKKVTLPKEGIVQMHRAARNAQRKMDLVSGRLEQIESLIAEDHRPDNSRHSNYTDNNNLESGSSSENSYDLALDSQSSNSPPIGSNNNNVDSTAQNVVEQKWSASVPNENDSDIMSGRLINNHYAGNKNKSTSLNDNVEWSPPVNQIKSVIPTRQTNQNMYSVRDNNLNLNDNDGQSRRDSTIDADQINEQQESAESNLNNNNNNNSNDQMGSHSMARSNHTNERYYPQTTESTASSMLGSDWSPNQNYNFFNELNAKNHNTNDQHLKSSSLIKTSNNNNSNNNGAVAFRPSSNKGNKFQDMTVVNSETDLLNSFSTQQQHSLPEIAVQYPMTTTSPMLTPLTTTTSTTTTTTKRPEQVNNNNNRRSNSIFTYTASNYGRSSKDQSRAGITTNQITTSPDIYEPRAQIGPEMSSAQTSYDSINDTNRYSQERPIQWPLFASSYSNNQQQQQTDSTNQRYPTQQVANNYNQMLTQESGHSETIQPKTSGPEEDGNLIPIDNRQQASFSNNNNNNQGNNNYQMGGTNINRQLSFQEENNYYNPTTDQSMYVTPSSYQARPNINSQMDDLYQESSTEPTYDKNKDYYTTNGYNTNYQTNNNNNNLDRQQQLSRMAAAIVANNPSLNNVDIESLLSKYQQHQRKLASQLLTQNRQQQQQFLNVPLDSPSVGAYANSYSPSSSISRAFYTTTPYEQQQTHSVNKRYSPEMQMNSYLNYNRQIQPYTNSLINASDNTYSDSIQLPSDLISYTTTSPQYQAPLYSTNYDNNVGQTIYSNNNNNNRALRAYYKALTSAAAAAAATNAIPKSYYDSNQAYNLYQQASPSLYSNNNNNFSSGSGALYATAAMNNPTFYDISSGRQQQPSIDSYSTSATNNIITTNQQLDLSGAGSGATLQQQQTSQASSLLNGNNQQYSSGNTQQATSGATTSTTGYKRGYLNSLFKPTASSRYYYTPTILSPISLASPTTVHSLYAPATIAAAETIPSIYAAPNPYSYIQAQHPSAVDQSAQYQAFAAAANSLQPHYMDPDMAESSLVSSDSQTTGAMGSENDASSNNNNGSGNNNSKSNGKGMAPWTNIAGLLLGILPFGILMASLLPAVTVAGRKKRELDFITARNFSDLLNWRAPSKVLNALIAQQNSSSLNLTNASDIINEQLASFTSNKNKHSSFNSKSNYNRRRSLGTSGSSFIDRLLIQPNGNGITMGDRSNTSNNLVYNLTPPTESSSMNNNYTTSSVNGSTVGVKAKVKKAISALNSFITAAQNIKRKHRSSIIENQWNIPSMFKNFLKFENLFNLEEFKRQLASVAHTGVVLAQQKQQLQATQLHNNNDNNSISKEKKFDNNYQTTSLTKKVNPISIKSDIKSSSGDYHNTTTSILATTTTTPLISINVTDSDEVNNNYINRAQVSSPFGKDLDTASSSINKQIDPTMGKEYYSTSNVLTDGKKPEFNNQKQNDLIKLERETMDNSTKRHLEVCLNQFLCRLTVKLNKSLKNSLITNMATTNDSQQSPTLYNQQNKKSFTQPNPDQLERITKKYINQLIEQIEAENPSVLSNLQSTSISNKTGYNNEADIQKNSGLDLLYMNAMKNQCSLMYNCIELNQLEKTLSKMKLKFS